MYYHTTGILASRQSEPSYKAVSLVRLTCRFMCIRQHPVLSSSTSALALNIPVFTHWSADIESGVGLRRDDGSL